MNVKKAFLLSLALLPAIIFSGCQTALSNLTPRKVPENHSGIYTFSVKARTHHRNVKEETVRVGIVINQKIYRMKRSRLGSRIFTYDFEMPEGYSTAKYYFVLK